ncbi:MAG: hypothetical protein OEZ34_08115 [Spirochaetia bacterium]|nr:hypothetical protein [Spirochaetia bacterium]
MRVGIFIQARSGSSRYPGKIFEGLPVEGAPSILEHIYRRLSKVRGYDVISVLAPESDERLIQFCKKKKFSVFTGPEEDVRQRYRNAAEYYNTDLVIRATGDNPCVDPGIAEETLSMLKTKDRLDLFSFYNLPLGIAVEAFRKDALFADVSNDYPEYREHVSLHIKQNPGRFRILHADHPSMDFPCEALPRLTVDTAEDLQVVRKLFSVLGKDFTTSQIMRLAEKNPEIFTGNLHVKQKTFAIHT